VPSANLDALAARGIRFENSYCTAPQCSPSRATLYTGRYAHSTGMFGLAHDPFNWRLYEDEVYLAAYLQEAGYTTALFGIQHVTKWDDESVKKLGYEHVIQGHDDTSEVVKNALAFLSGPHDRPFFLNVGLFQPHRDGIGRYKLSAPDDSLGVEIPPYLPNTPEAREEIADLQGAIRVTDEAFGAIWNALEAHNLLEDSWVIFTTDHGLAMPRAKCTMYDAGLETALIMYNTALGLMGERVIRHMVSHVDLLPTILHGLGLPIPERVQGRSYWDLLLGRDYQERDVIFAEKTFHTAYEPQRAVRSRRYKLILNLEVDIINVPADIQHSPLYPQMIDELTKERPQVELYDLMNDPQERTNLAGQPHLAVIERHFLEQLLRWMEETDDPILKGPIASPYYEKAIGLIRDSRR
jgi:N-sulfoglucosamine sulfohydrolase